MRSAMGTQTKPDVARRDETVRNTLAGETIHQEWIANYEGGSNDAFYEMAIDRIVDILKAPAGSTILDAGCGEGAKSIRLARRGLKVVAIDYSQVVLDRASQKIGTSGVGAQITQSRQDLCSLTYDESTFAYVLCWGVLMHVPSMGLAIAELCRVVQPGGWLVIAESNAKSLQSSVQRTLMRVLGKDMSNIHQTEYGYEKWRQTGEGMFMTRNTNIGRLIKEVESHGFSMKARMAAEFTELYVIVPTLFLKRLIYSFNRRWFAAGGGAGPAFGNLLFFRKGT